MPLKVVQLCTLRAPRGRSKRVAVVAVMICAVLLTTGCSRNAPKEDDPRQNAVRNDKSDFSSVPSQPSDISQTLALAEAAYAAKDWQAAEKNYVIITRAIPKESTPWFRLGNIYARTERPDFAVRAYKEALVREPSLGKAWYNMGLVQLRQSANSFLQMSTQTDEKSEEQIRATTMYEATIGLIKEGPKRVRSYPYESAPTAALPTVTDLPEILPAKALAAPLPAAEKSQRQDNGRAVRSAPEASENVDSDSPADDKGIEEPIDQENDQPSEVVDDVPDEKPEARSDAEPQSNLEESPDEEWADKPVDEPIDDEEQTIEPASFPLEQVPSNLEQPSGSQPAVVTTSESLDELVKEVESTE